MITFVMADEASLDAFLAVSAASPYHTQLEEYLGSLLRQRATRPEWCLLGLEAGAPVARGRSSPMGIVGAGQHRRYHTAVVAPFLPDDPRRRRRRAYTTGGLSPLSRA